MTLGLDAGAGQRIRLHVRRVNQADAWQEIAMDGEGGRFTATVPAAYTDSRFRLQHPFAVAARRQCRDAAKSGTGPVQLALLFLRQA